MEIQAESLDMPTVSTKSMTGGVVSAFHKQAESVRKNFLLAAAERHNLSASLAIMTCINTPLL
jgi:tRNA splicing endonuclease